MKKSAPWHRFLYHGEVIGFFAAWVLIGLVALSASQREEPPRPADGREFVAKQPSEPGQ
ncbi:MAG: hypothetical protein AAGJ46_16095 [Planctomycetota bacterium]